MDRIDLLNEKIRLLEKRMDRLLRLKDDGAAQDEEIEDVALELVNARLQLLDEDKKREP